MTAIRELNDLITEQTLPFRKGEEVRVEQKDGITVVNIDGFPPSPIQGKLVDVHFIQVGFTEASADKAAFLKATQEALSPGAGEFADMDAATLAQGPSYITLGGWLGDQTQALLFMALCCHHEVGTVITPATLGITEPEEADVLAGRGMVMVQVPEAAWSA